MVEDMQAQVTTRSGLLGKLEGRLSEFASRINGTSIAGVVLYELVCLILHSVYDVRPLDLSI